MYLKTQGVSDATSAINEYNCQIESLNGELSATSQTLHDVNCDYEKTLQQLASGLLTTYSEDEVSNVANETGAIHLKTKYFELKDELERDKSLLTATADGELYQNREKYLDPLVGTISKPLAENESNLKNIDQIIDELESAPHFHWVKSSLRKPQRNWASIWSILNLSFLYKKKRFNECEDQVGELSTAFDKHDEFLTLKKETAELIEALEAQKKPVVEAVELVDFLSGKIDAFEATSLITLRSLIAGHFKECDLRLLLDTIRPDAKILLSKLDALMNKKKHLEDIASHAKSEISDRESRRDKISYVLLKWKRSSRSQLSGDKTKWLVDTPAGCRRRTTRFVNSYSDNRHCIHVYSDYNGYSNLFTTGLLFASFSVFANDGNVDSYVAREVYSEIGELAETDAEVISDGELAGIIESDSLEDLDISEPEAFDEADAS
jgi:hypothetical protein